MAPDFPYIIGSTDYRDFGHRFPGIIAFTIPASLFALWMFHNVIKRPVVGLLPAGMQLRLKDQLGSFRFGGLARFAAIMASILLGIASHVVWDSFTHAHTWAYFHFRWLRGWVQVPFVGIMPRHSALQYGSSVFGLLALAVWVLLWYQRTPAPLGVVRQPPTSRFTLAVAMFVFAAVIGLVRALVEVGTPATRSNADAFLLVFGVTALALAFWQLVFYCVLVSSYQVW